MISRNCGSCRCNLTKYMFLVKLEQSILIVGKIDCWTVICNILNDLSDDSCIRLIRPEHVPHLPIQYSWFFLGLWCGLQLQSRSSQCELHALWCLSPWPPTRYSMEYRQTLPRGLLCFSWPPCRLSWLHTKRFLLRHAQVRILLHNTYLKTDKTFGWKETRVNYRLWNKPFRCLPPNNLGTEEVTRPFPNLVDDLFYTRQKEWSIFLWVSAVFSGSRERTLETSLESRPSVAKLQNQPPPTPFK